MPLKFTLQDTMNRYGISQKALSEASGVRMNTIKDMRENNVKSLTVTNIDAILNGLHILTGERHGLGSLFIYEDCE